MKNIKKYKTKIKILLIIIIILQLIYKIYVDYTKEDFFIDEIYSYGLMNNDQAFIFEREDFKNAWHTGTYFNDYITVNSDEVLNLSAVYKNQVEDVHPPLYYLLLRIAATFTINTFTKWTGLILNLIIFTLSAIVVYKIGRNLFKNSIYALLLVVLYGFSLFSMQNTSYIRMYQLLELQLLMLVYWHIKNFNKELNKKELIKLAILVITGFLTHYYYVVFAIGIYLVNMLQYIKEKQWKNILKYNLTLIISAIIAIAVFPASISHVFKGYRGKDSINKFVKTKKLKTVWTSVVAYIKLIRNNIFDLDIKYMAIFALILIPIILWKRRKLNDKIMYLVVPLLTYLFVIIKSAPFVDLRYVVSIMAFILIIIIYIIKNGLQAFIKNRKIVLVFVTILVIIYSIPTLYNKKFKYIYYENKEQIKMLEEYKTIPCIYLYNDVKITYNKFASHINYLRMLDNVYILSNDFIGGYDIDVYSNVSMAEYLEIFNMNIEDIDIDIKDILKDEDTSKGILVFSQIYNYKIMSYILEEMNLSQIDEVIRLQDVEVYLLH